ncbi:hypothetical protein AMTRI_Chr11g157310 [Amborella trichopoda]
MGLSFEQDFFKDPKRLLKLEDMGKSFQSRAFGVFNHIDSYEKLVILCSLDHIRNHPKHVLWLIRYRITTMFSTKKNGHSKHLYLTVHIRVGFHSILGHYIFRHLT